MINQFVKIFKKSRFVLYSQIIDRAFYFISFLILARFLLVDEYGNIVLIFSVSNILLNILQIGLPIYFQRQSASINNIYKKDLNNALIYGFVSYILSTIVVLSVLILLFDNTNYLLILIIHTFVYSYYFISIFNSILLGKGKQKPQYQAYLYSRAITVLIIVIFWYIYMNIVLFIIVCTIGNILIAVYLYFYIYKSNLLSNSKRNIPSSSIKYLILVSLPIGIAASSNFLYDKIDVIIISKIIDIQQVAFYNIAYGIFKSSQLLFAFFLITGFTRVSYLSSRKYAVKLFLKKYSVYIVVTSTVIAAFLFFLSGDIIKLIYGEKYFSSVVLLQMLSFAIIPLSLNNLTGITMNGLCLFKENMYVMLSALLLNILLNVFLLQIVGIMGAVYATIITEIFILLFDLFYLGKKLV